MDGRSHFIANNIILFTTFGIVGGTKPELLQPAMVGAILGTVITPDYDFKHIYIKSVIKKIPILGEIWNAYWWLYAVMFKHRKLSHNAIFGTLTRFVYLFFPISIISMYYQYHIDIYSILIILTLWYIQDFSHYILDLKIFSKADE